MDSDQKIESRFHRTFALPKSIDSFGENQSAILRRRAKSADFRRRFPLFPRRVTCDFKSKPFTKKSTSPTCNPERRNGSTPRSRSGAGFHQSVLFNCLMANLF